MPMIGSVDPYDDTRFNQMQMRLVIPELRRLAEVEQGFGDLVKQFIFESAIPEIREPLIPELAERWLSRLGCRN